MAVTNDSVRSDPAGALPVALTSARRAVDVAQLVLDYDPSEPGALTEALFEAWDAGAAASEADQLSRRRSRRPR